MAYVDHDANAEISVMLCRQRDNENAMRDLHHGDPAPTNPAYAELWTDDANGLVKISDESVWRNAWPLGPAYRLTRYARGRTQLGAAVVTGFYPQQVSLSVLLFASRTFNKQQDLTLTFVLDDASPPQGYTDRLLAGNHWISFQPFAEMSTGFLRCYFLSTGFAVAHFPNIAGQTGGHVSLEPDVLLVRGYEAWA